MAEIVNLNKARKRRARDRAGEQAAANRVKFGRTREQKERDRAEDEAARRKLDQLKLEDD